MGVEKSEFIPGPNCIDPNLCNLFEKCLEATVVSTEIRYESEKCDSSNLEGQLAISTCQNEQAREARRSGNNVLGGG